MLIVRARVRSVERPSPSFVRIELADEALADFGVDGPLWDQRIKLILPGRDGVPELAPDTWWEEFLALPDDSGVAMRTYTIADIRGSGADTCVVVDVVVHPGEHGPGSAWAESAAVGDEVLLVGPRRGEEFGGIEFAPGDADRVLLVADETALPAVVQILRDFPGEATGAVFVEVPQQADVADLPAPAGVEVTWLPRQGRPIGEALIEAVSGHLGFARTEQVAPDDVDPELWETPSWSSSGETVDDTAAPQDGRYAWIAGESRMVTTLRRHLVNELALPRRQVAFMGYWREGVAMRG